MIFSLILFFFSAFVSSGVIPHNKFDINVEKRSPDQLQKVSGEIAHFRDLLNIYQSTIRNLEDAKKRLERKNEVRMTHLDGEKSSRFWDILDNMWISLTCETEETIDARIESLKEGMKKCQNSIDELEMKQDGSIAAGFIHVSDNKVEEEGEWLVLSDDSF